MAIANVTECTDARIVEVLPPPTQSGPVVSRRNGPERALTFR